MSIVAKVYRGDYEDLTHHGRIVVADAQGRILYHYGDAQKITFARSSAKPMQAIAVCESGALEAYDITQRELAVICSSHNGEPFHVQAVRDILEKAGLDESYLHCGAAYPISESVKNEMLRQDVPPDSIHCDCSGKHAGMLLTAKRYGEPLTHYDEPGSPVQERLSAIVADVCGCAQSDLVFAVDGCGVPVHGLPFYRFAQGFARMASPECFGAKRAAAIRRITDAMTTHPDMVAGTDRLCTDLMRAFGDRLFGKSGAASFYGIGIQGRGIGIAVKIEDGCSDFVRPVVAKVLADIGVLTREEAATLTPPSDFEIYNHHRTVVGRIQVDFALVAHKS